MDIEFSEDFRGVEKVLIVEYSVERLVATFKLVRSGLPLGGREERGWAYFLAFHASKGRLSTSAIQYPLTKKRMVRNACTAASGTMYVLSLLQRSMGLI